MAETKSKPKKPAKACNCLEQANEQLKPHNTKLVRELQFDMKAMTGGMTTRIKLATEKIETRKPAKDVYATYCPICGKKYPGVS